MAERLEGPGSEERLKRAQQGFREASRNVRWRDFVGRWWMWGAVITAAALYVAWQQR
ncbi:MAG: hypothetical protein NT015_16770 [Alphaproteobacteria bacterium]|nr:hypothetical protein [Alphaproteobacteria bacterium]